MGISMKGVATCLSLVGACLLAANLGVVAIAYVVMMASSLMFITLFWGKEWEIVALNVGFCVINLIGVMRWMT